MRLLTASTLLLALASPPTPAGEHHHEHGVAQLEVAVDGPTLSIHLESPLGNLLGFEHAPSTARENQAAQALLAALGRGEDLFTPTAAAGCKLAGVRVAAPALQGQAGKGRHADLDADWTFTCARPARLTGLKIGLFAKYPGLKRLNAAVVSGKGQTALRLTGRQPFLSW